jgi:dihydroorotase
MLLVKNGRVLDPASKTDAALDILLDGEKIEEVAAAGKIAAPQDVEIFDAAGLIVAPGFIDLHVHLREPGREDCETIESGTAAAAAGGFTSVCAMPNTQPVNDDIPITQRILRRAEQRASVRVFPIAAVTRSSAGEMLTDFEALMAAGAVAFSDDGKPVKTAALMQQALKRARHLSTFVSDHCEDLTLAHDGVINEGIVSRQLKLRGLPPLAEDAIVERDLRLAQETGGHVHIAHLSTQGALELVRRAKRDGVNVTCEATPHHLSLSEEAVKEYGPNAKMKPPLRTAKDVAALVEGIADGTVDAIATDHAPHSAEEKKRGLVDAPFGIIGLETAVALAVHTLIEPKVISWSRLVELFSSNPARILGRQDLGRIEVGALSDFTLVDPGKEWTFHAANSRSKSRNTPFDGWKFRGRVVKTIVSGKTVFDAGFEDRSG